MTHPMVRWGARGKLPEPPPFRQRVAALKYVPPLLGMVWRTHRGYASAIFALRIARAFVPVATLYVGKLIIDAVILATQGKDTPEHVLQLVALEFGIVAIGEALHARIADSKLVVLAGPGHVVNLEAPERFNEELRRFLRAVG